jgi:D-arabinose 1-dehydrogenase-like Zn-dependent alcohol dehydrogenase
VDVLPKAGVENGSFERVEERNMNITAAVAPVRSDPFEIETFDLAAPSEEVLVRVVARGMYHTDLHGFTRAFGDDDS